MDFLLRLGFGSKNTLSLILIDVHPAFQISTATFNGGCLLSAQESLEKISQFLNSSCLLTLFYSSVYPYLTYAMLYGSVPTPRICTNVHIIQKRFVRIKPRDPSFPLVSKLKILTMCNLSILQICIFIYKVKYQGLTLPDHLQLCFHNHVNTHSMSTRETSLLYAPLSRTTRGQQFIKYRGVSQWNNHIHMVRSSSSLPVYRRKSKENCAQWKTSLVNWQLLELCIRFYFFSYFIFISSLCLKVLMSHFFSLLSIHFSLNGVFSL